MGKWQGGDYLTKKYCPLLIPECVAEKEKFKYLSMTAMHVLVNLVSQQRLKWQADRLCKYINFGIYEVVILHV